MQDHEVQDWRVNNWTDVKGSLLVGPMINLRWQVGGGFGVRYEATVLSPSAVWRFCEGLGLCDSSTMPMSQYTRIISRVAAFTFRRTLLSVSLGLVHHPSPSSGLRMESPRVGHHRKTSFTNCEVTQGKVQTSASLAKAREGKSCSPNFYFLNLLYNFPQKHWLLVFDVVKWAYNLKSDLILLVVYMNVCTPRCLHICRDQSSRLGIVFRSYPSCVFETWSFISLDSAN